MDNLLVKSAKVAFRNSPFHGKEVDILVENGIIVKIAPHIGVEHDQLLVVDASGQYVAPGFFDMNANFGEPGLETKEDILSGCAAAVAGGFTGVAVHPNTQPPVHSRSEVALIVNRAKTLPVDVFPIGAISKKRQGEELAELYDMKLAGAVAFGDGDRPVQQAGLMSRALLYAKGFDGVIVSYPEDASVAGGAKMNEGVTSTYLGMKGNPNLAEELMVARDLHLAEYNEAAIHFTTISTAESVNLIRNAKASGIRVTCDVAAHHLIMTDELVVGFDSNYKVNPPLRTDTDVMALRKGLEDGTIDAIVSQHTPHEVEFKQVEFQVAAEGIIGLQTVLPLALEAGLSVDLIVDKLAVGPRRILGLPIPEFQEQAMANFILLDTGRRWRFDQRTNRSKSSNSPLLGKELTGQVTMAVNKRQMVNTQH
ncbi:dihydroorotase [Parapedobacter sp. ISTM3]|uniref:Dihydroorotase n=1 Tax=Parapedobacter luteus TaxID=623280 RepID=A0A1T5F0P7_9SPHI|nr:MULTISPECIES: dihydroorotase [Parapedobacter]MBK1439283.1 dihydroorotase [Parapedobacter sp. ISTM3]SKB89696.1 dihydroorotase [Parapedobacter luteus]